MFAGICTRFNEQDIFVHSPVSVQYIDISIYCRNTACLINILFYKNIWICNLLLCYVWCVTLRGEQWLRVFGSRVLRGVSGAKGGGSNVGLEKTTEWGALGLVMLVKYYWSD
jgi:hypothetical protein